MRSQTFEASTTIQQQRTILIGVTHVSITVVNTTQKQSSSSGATNRRKIRQGCAILVHERGERRATRI
jgi:hypothetical protein